MKREQRRRQDIVSLWQKYAESRLKFGEELIRVLAAQTGFRAWKGAKVLDLGCGDGGVAQAFVRCGAKVVAIDYSVNRLINVACRLPRSPADPSFHLLAGDGGQLPFVDEVFDLVILCDVIEHVKNPSAVLQEVTRVLRPEGMLYASVPNRFSLVNLLSDPHYNVPGVGLMPRWMAVWYVTKLLRLSDHYSVERYFSRGEVPQLFLRADLCCQELQGRYETKIHSRETPNAPSRRWMVRALELPGVRKLTLYCARGWLFKWFIEPGWEFLAFKRRSASVKLV